MLRATVDDVAVDVEEADVVARAEVRRAIVGLRISRSAILWPTRSCVARSSSSSNAKPSTKPASFASLATNGPFRVASRIFAFGDVAADGEVPR